MPSWLRWAERAEGRIAPEILSAFAISAFQFSAFQLLKTAPAAEAGREQYEKFFDQFNDRMHNRGRRAAWTPDERSGNRKFEWRDFASSPITSRGETQPRFGGAISRNDLPDRESSRSRPLATIVAGVSGRNGSLTHFGRYNQKRAEMMMTTDASRLPPDEYPTIVTRHCDTVGEFLQLLSPRSQLFQEFGPWTWLYRGHADAEYQLLPSALRDESCALRQFVGGGPPSTTEEQVFLEMHVLAQFFVEADRAGLPIPEDTQTLRRMLNGNYPRIAWPPEELLSLMAIGQHHGLPTRLLDWTWHPLKAAYFAASGAAALENPAGSGRLAVWVMSRWLFEFSNPSAPLAIATAPSNTNPNLRAQEGVFTRTRPVTWEKSPIDRRSVDEIVSAELSSFTPIGTSLFHFTLPQECCGELLWELARDGITRPRMFPDYYGVVDGMREQQRHDPPPNAI